MPFDRSPTCRSRIWCNAATSGCSPTAALPTRRSADAAGWGGALTGRWVAVAFSGGRDSTALLHATAVAAASLGVEVIALHVHHGLSDHADEWLAHCAATCRGWARRGLRITFASTRIDAAPAAGESVEAWARRARYRALHEMCTAAGADLLLLGHHRRDQAETFLLQALRSGGVAALSAMPVTARRDGVTWARPWLKTAPELIERYARTHRLRWIEDDSNADTRFARNRLRIDVWPVLAKAFPDAETTLAAAAVWAQQAAEVIGAVAAVDVARIVGERGLSIAAWRELDIYRQSHAMRAWLFEKTGQSAPASLIDRLLAELDTVGSKRWPTPCGELRSYRGSLQWHGDTFPNPDGGPTRVDLSQPGPHAISSWGGVFDVREVNGDGLSTRLARHLTLRARAPGDRFQLGPDRPPRSLKLQYQAAAIPASQRRGPIVCAGDRLVFVPGLGLDARVKAESGEPQISLRWSTSPA
ncbi:MAG: tRNA lysidine(34) synthetase TilS [Caldimonas sp.]